MVVIPVPLPQLVADMIVAIHAVQILVDRNDVLSVRDSMILMPECITTAAAKPIVSASKKFFTPRSVVWELSSVAAAIVAEDTEITRIAERLVADVVTFMSAITTTTRPVANRVTDSAT